jgi:hypothetical protein
VERYRIFSSSVPFIGADLRVSSRSGFIPLTEYRVLENRTQFLYDFCCIACEKGRLGAAGRRLQGPNIYYAFLTFEVFSRSS